MKYKSKTEFKRQSPGAYCKAMRENWLDDICYYMNTNILNNIKMEIKINELEKWLVECITTTIHDLKVEGNDEFNKWAKNFKQEEAEFVVNMEFGAEWGYEEREAISAEEAYKYAMALTQKIVDVWYL